MKKIILTIVILLLIFSFTSCSKIYDENDNSINNASVDPHLLKTWDQHKDNVELNFSEVKLFSPKDYFVGKTDLDLKTIKVRGQGLSSKYSNIINKNKLYSSPGYIYDLDNTNMNLLYNTMYSNIFNDENIKNNFIKNSSVNIKSSSFYYTICVSTNDFNVLSGLYNDTIDLVHANTNKSVFCIPGDISTWIVGENVLTTPIQNSLGYSKCLVSNQSANIIYKSFAMFYIPYLQVQDESFTNYELHIINIEVIEETINQYKYSYYIQENSIFDWNTNEHFCNGFDENLRTRFDVLFPFLKENQIDIIDQFLSL